MEQTFSDQVNNEYYHTLGKDWHTAKDDPIALLRAESKLKNPWVQNAINKSLGKGPKKILDIGCGAGFLSNYLATQGHKVSGLDMSNESLEIAREFDQTKSVNYQYGDAYKLPFEDQSLDVVCAMDFLEHVEDPEKVISEASRVLRHGGLFFYHTFSKNLFAYLLVIKMVEWILPKTPKNLHILRLFISPKALIQFNENQGLTNLEILGIRPRVERWSFWKSLFKREVQDDFSFAFTKSTLISYLGYAKKA